MDKAHIIVEIQRTATANGGKPLGQNRFETETGIKIHEWRGIYWARWGDALIEAGFKANSKNVAYNENFILKCVISKIRELGHYPTTAEFRLFSRIDDAFPGYDAIRRIGRKADVAARIVEYCSNYADLDDVLEICRPIAATANAKSPDDEGENPEHNDAVHGCVYLMKSGRHYKIGHSNSAGRREYELGIQLPEPVTTVHTIATDDPVGIEAYWHKRFEAKRLKGEWFKLDRGDVRAFKRRKFM